MIHNYGCERKSILMRAYHHDKSLKLVEKHRHIKGKILLFSLDCLFSHNFKSLTIFLMFEVNSSPFLSECLVYLTINYNLNISLFEKLLTSSNGMLYDCSNAASIIGNRRLLIP